MFEFEENKDSVRPTTGYFAIIKKAEEGTSGITTRKEDEELEEEQIRTWTPVEGKEKLREPPRGAGGLTGEWDDDYYKNEIGSSKIVTHDLYEEAKWIFDNDTPPAKLSSNFIRHIKENLYCYGRENGFAIYTYRPFLRSDLDSKTKIVHGTQGEVGLEWARIMGSNEYPVLIVGHTHDAYERWPAEWSWRGITPEIIQQNAFLRQDTRPEWSNSDDEWYILCSNGIPSGTDLELSINLKWKNAKTKEMVIGYLFTTFVRNGEVYAVYDTNSGKKVGTNIKYYEEVISSDKNNLNNLTINQEQVSIILENGTDITTYNMYGAVTELKLPEVKVNDKLLGGTGEGTSSKDRLVLMDDSNNIYEIDSVSILSSQYSPDKYDTEIPTPFVLDEKMNIISKGATVYIDFPRGRKNPVVVGCINTLGNQKNSSLGARMNMETLSNKKTSRTIGTCQLEDTKSNDGDSKTITNGGYNRTVKEGSVYIGSDKSTTLEGEDNLNLVGKTVEIGGIMRKDVEDEDVLKNKADKINLFAKKVYIGHSNERVLKEKEIKLDDTDEIDDPKLQPLSMAYVNVTLLEDLIDKLLAARYIGPNGISRMVDTDKTAIKLEVKNKLPNMISEVGFILKNEEQTSNES